MFEAFFQNNSRCEIVFSMRIRIEWQNLQKTIFFTAFFPPAFAVGQKTCEHRAKNKQKKLEKCIKTFFLCRICVFVQSISHMQCTLCVHARKSSLFKTTLNFTVSYRLVSKLSIYEDFPFWSFENRLTNKCV